MDVDHALLDESVEDLYENAPCGYLSSRLDGKIFKVNRTFERWTGHGREELIGRRFSDLLTPAGRIYHETHYAPLLNMQGEVRAIALEIVRRDGSRLPALVNSVHQVDSSGSPRAVRTTVFDASDRRRYEQELLDARRREQRIAQELQRGLLTGERPKSPAFDIEVFYRPAAAGLEVGGDWHDAFWVDDNTVALVVGDVVGHDIRAAATMGQLRSATRALATAARGPAALLTALDAYSGRHGVGRMTTIVYAELQVDSGRLSYACAGHPPPVLVSPEGDVSFLAGGRSLPLDALPETLGHRPESAADLPPGAGLLLYTDGLVERRNAGLDEGLGDLLREVSNAGDNLSLSALVRRLQDDARSDDVCVVSLRLTPSG